MCSTLREGAVERWREQGGCFPSAHLSHRVLERSTLLLLLLSCWSSSRQGTKLIRGMEQLCCEEGLRELGLLSLEKKNFGVT